ncbi:MAG: hypothetical protein WCC64_21815 [Aliidongia sp.]
MLTDLWDFLQDTANRSTLKWLGGGITAVLGGVWAVIKFLKRKPPIAADHGSIAAGRDISGNTITTHGDTKR